jgi:hypothetical protein
MERINNAYVEMVNGKGKESGKPWKAVKITIGEWTGTAFMWAKTPLIATEFEINYIEKYIENYEEK